ncbi:DUF2460 domain-containing protein [Azospirillum brasilense]|uniref:DUF2460 domain-containing protein n=1 Tax=Azospirillum brasilense TaxID=192 RepID=UPI000E67A62B|nr:DUF2460 domain-containing protein [Azospirillum brasilense]NUB24707.1 TIGR02217 family protein [Azospirillum brasilense]NUB30689.1 TIGR02217 family protein [Azospirillum brasilense]RIW08298.1 TIGR02217 family protein [Azospirillum brasilense]
MAFHNVRFPDRISYGASGGPTFSTSIVVTASGREQRNQNWESARLRWDVSHALRSDEDIKTLIAFFRARRGKANSFRFKDWSDFESENEPIGVGDGSNKVFQLARVYNDIGGSQYRKITKPVPGSVRIFVNGIENAEGTHYSVDHQTGLVTFVAAPADGAAVQWSGEFDVPVRFDTDEMRLSLDYHNASSWQQIVVLEVQE